MEQNAKTTCYKMKVKSYNGGFLLYDVYARDLRELLIQIQHNLHLNEPTFVYLQPPASPLHLLFSCVNNKIDYAPNVKEIVQMYNEHKIKKCAQIISVYTKKCEWIIQVE